MTSIHYGDIISVMTKEETAEKLQKLNEKRLALVDEFKTEILETVLNKICCFLDDEREIRFAIAKLLE